ncbi:MAG: 2,3-bisphosphoglycerate-independent phosphoglycerate mutase [Desulfobacterales bacterium]|jgi:2,3-bisphosphoglycerate-independent phosphoglycerate mutase|nr:2,3-bisphosphoglycerate-independent phosphoglycerate mutase [Desulfobacterales bacterium]
MTMTKPLLLMILDGWGINPNSRGNAIFQANTPSLDALLAEYPVTRLRCSGEAVGLPDGYMGNSEVGHLNIGAGRIVYQELMRINRSISDGTFFTNEALMTLMQQVREKNGALHLMGLCSDSGVHSHLNHLYALLEMAKRNEIAKVHVHPIMDGRDSPPDSGIRYIGALERNIRELGIGEIATICGRYYAMDRDKRWDRTAIAFDLYTNGKGIPETEPSAAVTHAYARGETDEFIKPIILVTDTGRPRTCIRDNDGVIVFNFRADRVRQITRAMTDPDFSEIWRTRMPNLCGWVCMTLYDESFPLPVAFPPGHMKNILGEVISRHGLHQLRIAETEKYAHVTYFFNGGEETPFPNEDRRLIASPRDVPTYDHKPEMSAFLIKAELLSALNEGYDFIVLNFANMDMVGHTGVMAAAIKACEAVDTCVGEIVAKIKAMGGAVMVTADHGNAEKMLEDDGSVHTAHTLNPVPFVLVDDTRKTKRLREGVLGDIAPTVLEILGISQPSEMTGTSLLIEDV